MLRQLIPMISAASTQLIFLAIAFNSTSCSFIIRSTSEAEYCRLVFTPPAYPLPPERTDHMSIRPDISYVNDTAVLRH